MSHTTHALALLLVTALAPGCAASDEPPPAGPAPRGSTAAAQDNAKAEVKQAARTIQEYAYAQKADLVTRMKSDLAGLEQELDQLGAHVEKSTGEARAEAEKKLATAREKWTSAKQQIERVEGAAESEWEEAKRGLRQTYGDLKSSVATTRQWLSEKIAP